MRFFTVIILFLSLSCNSQIDLIGKWYVIEKPKAETLNVKDHKKAIIQKNEKFIFTINDSLTQQEVYIFFEDGSFNNGGTNFKRGKDYTYFGNTGSWKIVKRKLVLLYPFGEYYFEPTFKMKMKKGKLVLTRVSYREGLLDDYFKERKESYK